MSTKGIEGYLAEASSFEEDGKYMHLSAACMAAGRDKTGEDRWSCFALGQTFALWAIWQKLDRLSPDA